MPNQTACGFPIAVVCLAALAGCDDAAPGELALASEGGAFTRDATWDFGGVKMGTSLSRSIEVVNVGRGSLTLVALEHVAGDHAQIAGVGSPTAVWSVSFLPGVVIPPGGREVLPVVFRPPTVDAPFLSHAVELRLRAEDALADSATATLSLVGTGLSTACEVPPTLDFGAVAVDDRLELPLSLTNALPIPARLTLGEINSSSGDHAAFAFAPGGPRAFDLGIGETAEAPITFHPQEAKMYLAFVLVQPAQHCQARPVAVTGMGVTATLTWAPWMLDFKHASPGSVVHGAISFANVARKDVRLAFTFQNPGVFGAGGGPAEPIKQLIVPARGTAELPVWARPGGFGLATGGLSFTTDLPLQPSGSIEMKVFGGGPDIEVKPTSVSFGEVAYFAGASPPAFQRRRVTVRNVGTPLPDPGPESNLRLGLLDGLGNVIPGSYFTIVPGNAQTGAGEFTARLPSTYAADVGLVPQAGADAVEVIVEVTPQSLGLKEATLTIHSTDPDEPATEIRLSAEAAAFPPCSYSVTRTALPFGMVSPPEFRDQTFTIRNEGTGAGDVCLLSALELTGGTHGAFRLATDPINSRVLQPREAVDVTVRMRPTGEIPQSVTNVAGAVEFYLSSPVAPMRTVALSGQIGPSCLVIAPEEWSAGSVTVGCNSANATFRVFNRCQATASLKSIRVASAPTSDPACAVTAGCAFSITSGPAIPSGGLSLTTAAAPVTFQVRHRAAAAEEVRDALELLAVHDGANVTYRVPVRGLGTTGSQHTDVFARPVNRAADVLLVVGDTPTTYLRQSGLANGFGALTQYASGGNVLYQLGVTTSSLNGPAGALLYGTGHPESILTPTTSNLEAKFKLKLNAVAGMGIAEYPLNAALGALSVPLVNGPHSAFLRDNADLAVVIFSARPESSPWTVAHYLDALWRIKGHGAKHRFALNVMAPVGPVVCNWPDMGGRHALAASATGGRAEDICLSSLTLGLTRIGDVAFGQRAKFWLTAQPLDPSQIVVRSGAVTLPSPAQGGNAWTYDPVSNRLTMTTGYVPGPGESIEVSYPVGCY